MICKILYEVFSFFSQKFIIFILQGEMDDMATDVNFSGNLPFEKIMHRYLTGHLHLVPLKLGDLNVETKLSGSLLRP